MPTLDLPFNFQPELSWFPSAKIFDGEECFEAPHPHYHDDGSPLLYTISYDSYQEWTASFEGAILYKGYNLIQALIECEKDAQEPIITNGTDYNI